MTVARVILAMGLICPALSTGEDVQTSLNPVPLREAYDSWKLAKEGGKTAPATISAPEGFEIELVKTASEQEGSWVGMTFDQRGRIFLAVEKQGILRVTLENGKPATTEMVDSELLECRGLLWAYDSLYANANNSKGLYRLQDTDGDDRFDKKTLLLETEGGVGHGRNHLRLGPDGLIYIVHGNDVTLTELVEEDSPLRNFEEDQLIANPWDDEWFNKRAFVPAGHILRTDQNGSFFEVVAGGLRNPLDIDFHRDGEPFVYEADMEWESGLAWYKPTRVLHIVSGGDYGWRRATGKWPAYYEDSWPAAYDVGLGSPTGVQFGYRSNYPEKWRNALFIADWSYGRILAVDLQPDGATYTGTAETFLMGRPLNVTDLEFGPDGAMYFITGGRRTQSALYRVVWRGENSGTTQAESSQPDPLILLRRELEQWHGKKAGEGAELAKRHLDHQDRWVRNAARVALENQYPNTWQDWARESKSPRAVIALARLRLATTAQLVEHLAAMNFDQEPLAILRAYHLVFARCGPPDEATRKLAVQQLSPKFPAGDSKLDHELCELMVYLKAPGALPRILDLLDASKTTEDLSQYLSFSRYLMSSVQGTPAQCTEYTGRFLRGLRRMEEFGGGRWYERTVANLRKEAGAWMTDEEREQFADLLKPLQKEVPETVATEMVAAWRMADFDEAIERPLERRNFENGRQAFHSALCATCHRAGGIAATPALSLGPDLTGLGSRFGVADMLESIIHPSRVIGDKYINPAGPNVSLMPPGLINVLDRESVLDLLAFLQSGGNPEDRVFAR